MALRRERTWSLRECRAEGRVCPLYIKNKQLPRAATDHGSGLQGLGVDGEVLSGNSREHSVEGGAGEQSSAWDRRTTVKDVGVTRTEAVAEVQGVRVRSLPGRGWRVRLVRTGVYKTREKLVFNE